MPPTAARRDLAYTTALVAACQRMWAAPDVALLWRTIADEAATLIGADGAAVITYTDRFWQILAASPGNAARDDSAAAAALETFSGGICFDNQFPSTIWLKTPQVTVWASARYSWRVLMVRLGTPSGWCGMPHAQPPCPHTRTHPRHSPT
jgi:hypothetical protein